MEDNKTEITEIEEVIPSMNVTLPSQPVQQEECIISDQMLLGVYDEIMNNLRDDRKEVSDLLNNFVEMVINEGDSTSASKESIVNLVKIKTEAADKMSKIADLMTRLKVKDTFPKYLSQHAQQHNNITIKDSGTKRALLESINKANKANKPAN